MKSTHFMVPVTVFLLIYKNLCPRTPCCNHIEFRSGTFIRFLPIINLTGISLVVQRSSMQLKTEWETDGLRTRLVTLHSRHCSKLCLSGLQSENSYFPACNIEDVQLSSY